MSLLSVVALVLAAGDPGGVVILVTGEPAAPAASFALWRAGVIVLGVGAIAGAAALSVWRLRTSGFDAPERAFVALARRGGLGAGARELIRRAAAARGCEPVALLASRQALADALAALRRGGAEGDAVGVERAMGVGAVYGI